MTFKGRKDNMLERFNLENKPWFRKKLLALILVVVAVVAVMEIWMVNRLATYGEQLSKLDEIKDSLVTENELLENEIAEKSSLSHLGEAAYEQGYAPIKKIEYVKDNSEIASGQ
jgi:cell division protein FtsL